MNRSSRKFVKIMLSLTLGIACSAAASEWCDLRMPGEFAYNNVLKNEYGFLLKSGTLAGNMERFVTEFYPESNGLVNKVGRHLVPGDVCIDGDSPDLLLQKIIEPYFAGGEPVMFATFTNNFQVLYYKNDAEFSRYRIGVRK